MTRPSGPRGSGRCALACLLLAACGDDSREPSVLLVTVDTLRADRLSCAGYERETTPEIDALARESVLFERAYSMAPFTAPSHASLFTSLVTQSHGVTTWGKKLDPTLPSFFRLFRDAGFRTGAFHNHPGLPPSDLTDGCDEVQLFYRGPYEPTVTAFLEWAAASDRRFAAWVHLWDVHRPYGYRSWNEDFIPEHAKRPPLAFAENHFGERGDRRVGRTEAFYNLNAEKRATAKPTSSGPRVLTEGDLAYISDRYDGGVWYADRGVGELVDGLRASERLDSTVLILTSDHGESLLERESCLFTHDPFLYEETLRVPLVVRLPDALQAGRRVPDLVRGIDVLPTALELAGLATPSGLQGQSLVPLFHGRELPPLALLAQTQSRHAKETTAHADEPVLEFRQAIVTGKHKLVHDLSLERFELYDLAADPGERRDLAPLPEHAALLATMQARLAAIRAAHPERTAEGRTTPELEQELEHMGYADDG